MEVKTFYKSAFLRMIAEGMITPYISVFALALGATKTLIGLISAIPSLLGVFSQLVWAAVTEATRSKKWLIFLGGALWAVMWIPIAYVHDPLHLLFYLSIQAVVGSIAIPAWTILLIQYTPSYKRGETTAYLNIYNDLGTLLGTIAAGLILNQFGFAYFFFFIIFFFGLISRLYFAKKDGHGTKREMDLSENLKNMFQVKGFLKNKKMTKLVIALMFLQFSVSIAGPFFSVAVIQKFGGTNLDVGLISAVGVIASIIFYKSWGLLIDKIGKKAVMFSCVIPISLIPLVYAATNNIMWLYVYSFIGQMSWAGFNSAAFSYFSDIIPKENRSSIVSMYNISIGVSQSVAPFIGGMIVDALGSITTIFVLSFVLRLSSLYYFDRLEETSGFTPSGILSFMPWGINDKIEMFVSTYALAIGNITEEGRKISDIKRVKKLIKRT